MPIIMDLLDEYREHLKKEYQNNIGELPQYQGRLENFLSNSNEFNEFMKSKLTLIYMTEDTYNELLEEAQEDEEIGMEYYDMVLADLQNYRLTAEMKFKTKIIIKDEDEDFSFQSAKFVCELRRKNQLNI